MPAAIEVAGLCKSFGSVMALDHLELTVPEGTVHGLLGPNGAGKTTTVRLLSTLISPDDGTAEVFGIDVRSDPRRVRSIIGLTGQYAAVDQLLTGRENLHMIGRLFRLSKSDSRARASELLERFDLGQAADRQTKTYSGGMRRRLDLAASLMARPRLIFLDEPTTGLDPRSRMAVWQMVRELVAEGTTVLLTTQYLEEADQLADSLSVIDQGRVIAGGTPDELKAQVGQDWVGITLIDGAALEETTRLLRERLGTEPVADPETLVVHAPLADGGTLPDLLHLLKGSGVAIANVAVRRPTLDDVFLAVTGRSAEHRTDQRNSGKDTNGKDTERS
ncbi:ATP-binding cassette domain-containing protein [Streptomyces diastatochromogenes]|uniref:ABC-type xenobiotic transporter n=1 Tax=Streptomyces diastatochromogenes TaxID=42236 RepID=A0A233SMB9_STRDA|nr:ATP-binding cassette domain-containing protein [Streptomyces diastatochromogenes]MCZ0986401.1 ATP-binding cassette domain-containing protein [Streptomyces diastatochromogenes]OXY96777.1 ABC transporter [Streptomyces diastatochromogenes]